jgi:hypothetical protein
VDKYTTIHNILQAGIMAMKTIENLKLEDTPKDITTLIKILSHKLTTTKLKQDTITIENQIEHLNQKIDHLTKTLTNPYQIQNAAIHQHRKHLPHSTHNTPRKQPTKPPKPPGSTPPQQTNNNIQIPTTNQ